MSAQRTSRAVDANRIPSGEVVQIPADTEVVITQELGGSFTVLIPSMPGLYRIAGGDGDALGRAATPSNEAASGDLSDELIWGVLKTCYDPEIPVNIVDLGLVYRMELERADSGATVSVDMTLTAPGCGMGPVLAAEAESKLRHLPGVAAASVCVVWDPPWSPDRISPEGRAILGME